MRRRLSIYREFLVACLTFLTAVAWAQPQITYKINTLAGSRVIENGIQAVQAQLNRPGAVAVDGSGNLYIADSRNNSVRKVDSTGTITTVAGTGEYGFGGDGGPAVQALLRDPAGVAVDEAGNLYIADRENLRIRKVDSTGTITTFAGAGKYGSAVDTGPAVQAQLRSPAGVAVDGAGNLYIADSGRGRVFKVDSTGTITTVAGGLALEDRIGRPTSVAVDNAGNLYIAESLYNRIFKVDSTGTIATVVGASAQARLRYPTGVAVDNADNLYIADRNNHRILKIDSTGTITTFAGTEERGFGGDGGPAVQARLRYPTGVAVDGAGNLYIADQNNHRLRKVDSTGTIDTVAGTGESGFGGDNGAAATAQLSYPSGVAVDGAGNLYIADSGNHRIRRVDSTGTITTVAGTGKYGFGGNGGPAVQAQLNYPAGVAVDEAGNLYIADSGNHSIRKVDVTGTIDAVAGTGESGFSGDNGAAATAQLSYPSGVAVDGAGNLYIADTGNVSIRKVDSTGTITTVTDARGYNSSIDVAVDGAGNLYIADTHRIRKVDATGTITTVAGASDISSYAGDGGPAGKALLYSPGGVAVDNAGNLYIADSGNHSIRKIDATGTIDTVAGGRVSGGGFGGDGGLAILAQLNYPTAVAVDSVGNLYIADSRNERIRALTPSIVRTRLNFAHFASGAGITSDLVLVNVAAHLIRPAIYFYDQGGNPIAAELVVDVTGNLEITGDGALSIQKGMEPLEELTVSTHGRGGLVTGSVTVVSDGFIGGGLRFDLPGIGVTGVEANQPGRDAIFPARRQAGGISTAAAIRNLEVEAMVVSCQLMKEGTVLEEVEIPLAANGQDARYIEEVFTATDTSDFVGSVRCTAPPGEGMFTGVAVELDASNQILTTLPVIPVDRTADEDKRVILDFAHFANGTGITSEVVLVNAATRPIWPVIYFLDKAANRIAAESVVDVTGDLEVTEYGDLTVRTGIKPLGELTISTHGRGELVTGPVTVVSDGPIGGILRFDLPGIGVAGVGASQPARDAIFPVRRQEGGISTAAAIHNLGDQAMAMRCRLMKGGAVLEEVEIPLAAYGQEAQFIEEMFTGTDTSDFVGSVRCTSPTRDRFTGVAVELDAGNRIFTTLPVVPMEREREMAPECRPQLACP